MISRISTFIGLLFCKIHSPLRSLPDLLLMFRSCFSCCLGCTFWLVHKNLMRHHLRYGLHEFYQSCCATLSFFFRVAFDRRALKTAELDMLRKQYIPSAYHWSLIHSATSIRTVTVGVRVSIIKQYNHPATTDKHSIGDHESFLHGRNRSTNGNVLCCWARIYLC